MILSSAPCQGFIEWHPGSWQRLVPLACFETGIHQLPNIGDILGESPNHWFKIHPSLSFGCVKSLATIYCHFLTLQRNQETCETRRTSWLVEGTPGSVLRADALVMHCVYFLFWLISFVGCFFRQPSVDASMQVEFLTCTKEQLLAQVTQVRCDGSIYHQKMPCARKIPKKFWSFACSLSFAGLA